MRFWPEASRVQRRRTELVRHRQEDRRSLHGSSDTRPPCRSHAAPGAPARRQVRAAATGRSRVAEAQGQVEWEEHLVETIRQKPIEATEKSALILARRGQGLFKQRVRRVEQRCRLTGVDRIEHLRASHCKPWRDSSDPERLDGENGLLLTPTIDHLFDRGFISFEGDGRLLVSPVAHAASLAKMGVPVGEKRNVGGFSEGQRGYLEFHRERVFLEARVRR